MTPQEINIAIATACGWKVITIPFVPRKVDLATPKLCFTDEAKGLFRSFYPNSKFITPVPNYYGCLNACAEMERNVSDDEWQHYKELVKDISFESIKGIIPQPRWFRPISATAPQRCEAFLRTKGLWKE